MTRRTRLYVAVGVAAIGMNLAGLVLYSSSWSALEGVVDQPLWLLETPELVVAFFALAGLVIVTRQEDNAVARLLIQIGFFSGLFVLATGYSVSSQLTTGWPGGTAACWVGTWAWFPAFALLVSRLVLLYPDGAPPSPRWHPVARVSTGVVVLGTLAAATQPAGSANLPVPVACFTPPVTIGGPALGVALVLTMVLGCLALVALARKAMTGGRVVRAQIKWFALAAGLLVAAVAGREAATPESGVHVAFVALTMIAGAGVPTAIGVAILRYRLYDIDRLVSRTVSYAVVTAVLLGLFLSTVFLLQFLLPAESDLATAASTLAVAAAFNPLRRRIQGFIDRYFNRARYDAEKVAERFGRELRIRTAAVDPTADLQRTVTAALEPASVSVWLADDLPPRAGTGHRSLSEPENTP